MVDYVLHSYHVYKDRWEPLGEVLDYERELTKTTTCILLLQFTNQEKYITIKPKAPSLNRGRHSLLLIKVTIRYKNPAKSFYL